MSSRELIGMLDEAVARELQVSIQYMWQHILWKGVKGFAIKDELKKIAIEEMKHAEEIAERIAYLGGTPTTKPSSIVVGNTFQEMIEQDIKDEKYAIELYKRIIQKAQEENDHGTAHLFKKILMDEEEHLDFFRGVLEEL